MNTSEFEQFSKHKSHLQMNGSTFVACVISNIPTQLIGKRKIITN